MNNPAKIIPAPVRKTVHVQTPQAQAFRLFTEGMARWWRPDHHIAPTPFAEIVIEPRVGGRWLERDKDGAECTWGKVLAWEPPQRLILAWQLNGEWQYDPAFVTELEIRFIAEGANATRVELEHRDLEKYAGQAEAVRASLDSAGGWGGALAAYVAAASAA